MRPSCDTLTCGELRIRSVTSRLSVGKRRTSVSVRTVCTPWRVAEKSEVVVTASVRTAASCVACSFSWKSRRVAWVRLTTMSLRVCGAKPLRRAVTE